MKKLIFLIVILFGTTTANAQIEPGAWLISGSSAFSYNSVTPDQGGTTLNALAFSLKSGHFVAENLVFGVNFNYLEVNSGSGPSSSATGVGLFTRYYPNGKFFLGIGFNSTSGTGSSTTEFPLELGFAGFVANNIAIEPAFSYVKGNNYGRLAMNIGISIYLGRPSGK